MDTRRRGCEAALLIAVASTMCFGCVEDEGHSDAVGPENGAADYYAMAGAMDHADPSACTVRSKQDGPWSKRGTWTGRRVPAAGDRVCVEHRIDYDVTADRARDLLGVTILGSLVFSEANSTQLRVQDLSVLKGGLLRIGSSMNPLSADLTAEIVFVAMEVAPPTSPMFVHQLGLFSMGGRVELHGRPVDRIARLDMDLKRRLLELPAGDARAFSRLAQLQAWRQGDEVLFPATRFRRGRRLQNEVRTLSKLDAGVVQLDRPLGFNHDRILGRPLHAANLSANIVLRSAEPETLTRRGHVMVMPGGEGVCGATTVSGVRLQSLGRTDKSRVSQAPGASFSDNQSMMYGLHFHLCGVSDAGGGQLVRDSVLVDSPGWGFVNHGSDVVLHGNVAYDFAGAGFVAEAGTERGEFIGNLAVGGRGVNEYVFRRIYLGSKDRLVESDLGFHGDGFWISSPFIKVSGNAAIGNHGHGLVWYQTGVDRRFVGVDLESRDLTLSVEPSFLLEAEEEALGYSSPRRSWSGAPNRFLVSDLPIFQPVEDNYAAANFMGIRVRYARSFNSVFLKLFYNSDNVRDFIEGERVSERVFPNSAQFRNNVLQNNEVGLHTSYSTRIRFEGLHVEADRQLSTPAYDTRAQFESEAATGIEMNHGSNIRHVLRDVRVVGYPIGERASPSNAQVSEKTNLVFEGCDENTLTWDRDTIKRQRR